MDKILTREVHWSPAGHLHPFLAQSTYVWLVVAVGICVYGIWRHVQRWRRGQPEVNFDQPWIRIPRFLRNTLGQALVLRARRQRGLQPRSLYAAWMHGQIFYGFLALVFGTTIVALKEYHIVDVYHGWFYGFVTIACELGGLALTIGLGMGVFRRSQKTLDFKHGWDYSVLYGLLFVLAVQGFFLEAFRLSQQINPIDEKLSFIGYFLSFIIPHQMDVGVAEAIYGTLWYSHMLTTMAFVATLPYTRALHIVTASLNLYTQRLTPAVALAPLKLDNPDAEYFGPKTIRDFTWKDLLSFDSCTECRRCTDICPANAAEKVLDPRAVILKLRDSMLAEMALYEDHVISHDEIWGCTNCGACVHECPVGIDQLRTIMQLRRYQTLSLGEVPPTAAKAIDNIKQHHNPWGVSHGDRFKWAEGLDVPILKGDSVSVEWLYWVGCAGSYDASNQNVTKAVVNILKTCQVSFAVLGNQEKCSGEPVRRLGDEYTFSEIARSNVEQLQGLKFQKIVTHCPHCFNTLKNDYQDYGGHFEVYHHTQLLTQLHHSGHLKLPGSVRKDVTFHDPCFLGRHNGEYEAPRALLNAVAGLRLHEMTYTKETSHCCGMGGGNMWYESKGGHAVVQDRLDHVAATGAQTLVTGCSFCLINFKGAFKNNSKTQNLEVMDIAETINQSLTT